MHGPSTDLLFQDACDFYRPQWDGTPVTALQVSIILAASPVSLALLALSVFTIWPGNIWITICACLGWATCIQHIFFEDLLHDPRFTAQEIGCIGHSTLFIGVAIALCGAMMLHTVYVRFLRTH